MLQAGIHGYVHELTGRAHTGIAHALSECSYYLLGDFEGSGYHYTFSDDDVFAGQITWFVPYEALGLTRQEAAAQLLLQDDRLQLAPLLPDGTLGPAEDVQLQVAPVKSVVLPGVGHAVYRTFGVVLDLDPGEYLSTWTEVFDGQVLNSADVRLTITTP